MNLAVGLAESYAESVPVLAIVGQAPMTLEGRGAFQDSSGIGRSVDAVGMFRAISKYVVRLDEPRRFWEGLAGAVRAALTGRPGPAVLLIPRDAYELEVPPMPSWFPARLESIVRTASVSREEVQPLLEAIRSARRPVIVAGTGVSRSSDPDALTEFARTAKIPVATTMGDAGAFPNDDPLWLGMIGAAGHPSAHAFIEERVDLIIAVGAGLNAMTRGPITGALERARIAAINIDAGELLRAANVDVVLEADAGVALRALLAAWEEAPASATSPRDYVLTRFKPVLAEPMPAGLTEPPLLQSEAISMLEPYLPEDGHVLFDAGNCASAGLHYLQIPRGSTSTIALGMGGMGYAIAGAIGAQLGSPGARTVVLCGDGAFLMGGFEVHTAAELGLPILFVVFNNHAHGMCVTRQKVYFEGRVDCSEYNDVDTATVASGLGRPERLWVGRAKTRAELCERLAEYASAPMRTGVLELELQVEEVPPFAPFLRPGQRETYAVRTSASQPGARPGSREVAA
jgi:acetolactate synthase-1/2/3 large subunit